VILTETPLRGAFIADIKRFEDERGYFGRAWCRDELAAVGVEFDPVQANMSGSRRRGTVRGLHYQVAPHEEAKFIRCVRGSVFDVIVDLRADSPTCGQWTGVELSAVNQRALLVPRGFAHGYQTLEDDSEVIYLVSAFFAPGAEKGIRWNDPGIAIRWPITEGVILSDKDLAWPDFTPAPRSAGI
jgi:dTDP-4-dehydrorhamnose 3,5-epimerase